VPVGLVRTPAFPSMARGTVFTINDNVTKVLGKHTFKAGISIYRTRMWKGNPGTAFAGQFSCLPRM